MLNGNFSMPSFFQGNMRCVPLATIATNISSKLLTIVHYRQSNQINDSLRENISTFQT